MSFLGQYWTGPMSTSSRTEHMCSAQNAKRISRVIGQTDRQSCLQKKKLVEKESKQFFSQTEGKKTLLRNLTKSWVIFLLGGLAGLFLWPYKTLV